MEPQETYLEKKFVCGSRQILLCRKITNISKQLRDVNIINLESRNEISSVKQSIVHFDNNFREGIKITFNICAVILEANRQHDPKKLLILKVEDTFLIDDSFASFIFPHSILFGFYFRDSGLYLQFNKKGKQQQQSQIQINNNDLKLISCKNEKLTFSFSFEQTQNGFSANGTFNTLNSCIHWLDYYIEVMQEQKAINQENEKGLRLKAISQNRVRQESILEDDTEETHSQTDRINFEQENKNFKSKSTKNQEDTKCYCYSTKVFECSCNKKSKHSIQIQPKKNVVKNFVKAFRNFVNSDQEELSIIKQLGGCYKKQILKFRKQYQLFEQRNKFNNAFIKKLILSEQFRPVFGNFIQFHASQWLESSQVFNKEAHKEVLQDYLKAFLDPQIIESVYSLRTRRCV